jgi:alcohol dehydrogenase (cytochrome c)
MASTIRNPDSKRAIAASSAAPHPAAAQNLEPEQILHPAPDSWPSIMAITPAAATARSSRSRRRMCRISQLAWAFQTGQNAAIKSSPLLVDGILYFTVPDNIWAVDARSGHMLWHYNHPTTQGDHIGQRGVAMYKGWLFFVSPDCHLISLNAKDGTVRWTKISPT